MFISLSIACLSSLVSQPGEYRVIEVKRESVFAGRLGQRVRETLAVEAGGKSYRINVKGDYHTQATRPGMRFAVGDLITIASPLQSPVVTLDRDSIKRSR